jgi:VIT1/CCC1 family predicted Fe2+/Mn2+ transporter
MTIALAQMYRQLYQKGGIGTIPINNVSLIVLGTTAAKTGGSSVTKAIVRITIWGTIAMGLSALVGYIFGIRV